MGKYTDIHCHCLAGVDDGPGALTESIDMIITAYKDGIDTIIATPHFHYRRGHASPEKVQEALKALQNAVQGPCPDMKLYAGNELFYSSSILELLETGQVLPMADSDYVLVEFTPDIEFGELRNACYSIQSQGVWVILAHVERYGCLVENMKNARQLSETGVYFQVNAAGVLGQAGHKQKGFIRKLFKDELIHFVATDAHDNRERRPLLSQCDTYIQKKYGVEQAKACLWENPQKILKNQMI